MSPVYENQFAAYCEMRSWPISELLLTDSRITALL
ncbi:MAG: hypothetical protein GAK41_01438 [Burkholderia gladioli]|nr:MAG: hypothetical protein GAK41_01438 [Burkholderia gladioli]